MPNSFVHDVAQQLKNVFVMLVVSVVLGVLMQFIGSTFGDLQTTFFNSHETAIASYLIRAEDIDVTMEDVGGLESAKDELYYSMLLPLKHPKIFFSNRGPLQSTRGFLLCGPPGTGKTMLMKAVAKTCGCHFLCPNSSILESKYYGESSKYLTACFTLAQKKSPCIIFIDEIDSIFRSRSDDESPASYTLKCEFLALCDGLRTKSSDAVVVVGATNMPDSLDDALKRRLPNVLSLDLPTASDRVTIVRRLCKDEHDATSFENFSKVDADATDGMSGSDLAEVYKTASRLRLRRTLAADESKLLQMSDGRLPPILGDDWKAALESMRRGKALMKTRYAARSDTSALLKALQTMSSNANNPALAKEVTTEKNVLDKEEKRI